MRELTYYVAVSMDGFIAGPSGEFDRFLFEGDHAAGIWQKYPGTAPTDLAAAAGLPLEHGPFDTVLMGWNTYAVGLPQLPNPYRHLRQIVFTRGHEAPEGAAEVEFTDRDPVELVRELKAEDGAGIWLCGDGVRLFGDRPYSPAALRSSAITPYESGVVLAEYTRG